MTDGGVVFPPDQRGRTIGVVYLLYFLMAFLGLFLAKGIVVNGDVAATASNLKAHDQLYLAASVVGIVANVLYIVMTALFYVLFEQVNRTISLTAAFIGLVACAILIGGAVFQVAPLVVLQNSQVSSAFSLPQLHAAARLFLDLHARAFGIALVLFAFYDIAIGYLIWRSSFLPRFLGALMMLAGIGWLAYAWPPLAASMAPIVQPLGALAEVALMIWLLVKGAKAGALPPTAHRGGYTSP